MKKRKIIGKIVCLVFFIFFILQTFMQIRILKTQNSNFAGCIVKHRDFYGWINKTIKENGKTKDYWYYMDRKKYIMDFRNKNLIKDKSFEIDGKIYYFDKYGKLIENEGFKVLDNGKKMYFVPGNFGAYKSTYEKIDGKIYYFDENGYAKILNFK